MTKAISIITSTRWFLLTAVIAVFFSMPLGTASASSPNDGSTNDQAGATKGETFIRFEVSKELLANFSGTLSVSHGDEEDSTNFSGAAFEKVNSYLIFPEQMGEYEVTLVDNLQNKPALKVEGILSRSDDGEYTHRLNSGWADPDLFVLQPENDGLTIDLGSVKGYLESCVLLEKATGFLMRLGVDNDGNGVISEDLETTTLDFPLEKEGCVSTPEVVLPLTSMYRSRVAMNTELLEDTEVDSPEEVVIAYNEGVYDFLNKSGVSSEKGANAEIVQEFGVTFIRTPLASSVRIPNSAIHPPEVLVEAIPQTKEQTADIFRQGDRLDSLAPKLVVTEAPEIASTPNSSDGNRTADWLKGYWPILAGLVGLIVVSAMLIRNFALAHRHKSV